MNNKKGNMFTDRIVDWIPWIIVFIALLLFVVYKLVSKTGVV